MAFLAWLNRWLLIGAGIGLAVVILLTVTDVASSALRGRPITGVYDVVGTALVYIVFLGIPEVFRTRQNITVDVIDHFVSPRTVGILDRIAVTATLIFLVLLEFAMLTPAREAIQFDDHKPDSGIPYWFLWLPILLGTLVTIVAAVAAMWRQPQPMRPTEPPQ